MENKFESTKQIRKTILLLAKESLQKNIRETNIKIQSLQSKKSLEESYSPKDSKLHIRVLQESNQQNHNLAYLEKVLLELEKWKKELNQ